MPFSNNIVQVYLLPQYQWQRVLKNSVSLSQSQYDTTSDLLIYIYQNLNCKKDISIDTVAIQWEASKWPSVY